MALTPAQRRQAKMVDEFLASPQGGGQAAGFLGQLDQRIAQNRRARRAAQRGARGQATLARGLDKMRGVGAPALQGMANTPGMQAEAQRMAALANNTPASINARAFPSGAGGRQILSQGMGPVPPVQSRQLALPAGGGGGANLPATRNLPASVPQPSIGAGPQPAGALGPGQAGALGPGPRAVGPVAGTSARATQAGVSFVDDAAVAMNQGNAAAAGSAARNAGTQAAKAGTSGASQVARNLGVNITKQSMMRGAGVAGAGYMASQFFDGLNVGGEQSLLDKGGSGAILGAGLGGGAALALGLGTGPAGWAALGGAALIGGARALWGGDDTKLETQTKAVNETRESITELAGMYGIEGDALDDIMMQYDASTQMMIDAGDVDGLKNFMAGTATQLPALMLQAREQQKAGQQEEARYGQMMAAQAQFAPIFEQTLNRAEQANQYARARSEDVAAVFDRRHPQLGELFRQTSAQSTAAAANLRAAYARQMAQAPVVTGTSDELQRQLAQEELMAQQLAAGVGGL